MNRTTKLSLAAIAIGATAFLAGCGGKLCQRSPTRTLLAKLREIVRALRPPGKRSGPVLTLDRTLRSMHHRWRPLQGVEGLSLLPPLRRRRFAVDHQPHVGIEADAVDRHGFVVLFNHNDHAFLACSLLELHYLLSQVLLQESETRIWDTASLSPREATPDITTDLKSR